MSLGFQTILTSVLLTVFFLTISRFKIQDKLGASLFRKLLFSLREINSESLPMIDILNLLEKLEIIPSVAVWYGIVLEKFVM